MLRYISSSTVVISAHDLRYIILQNQHPFINGGPNSIYSISTKRLSDQYYYRYHCLNTFSFYGHNLLMRYLHGFIQDEKVRHWTDPQCILCRSLFDKYFHRYCHFKKFPYKELAKKDCDPRSLKIQWHGHMNS